MAKVGEGDPRWLVEQRQDGQNVNHWHWAERNVYPWLEEHAADYLSGVTLFEGEEGTIVAHAVSNLEGEAVLMVRKGRVKQIYDVSLHVKLRVECGGAAAKGTHVVKLRDLDQDGGFDECYCTLSSPSDFVKRWWRASGRGDFAAHVERMLAAFGRLREEWAAELSARAGKPVVAVGGASAPASAAAEKQLPAATASTTSPSSAPSKAAASHVNGVRCRDISDAATFRCRAGELFLALTEPPRVMAFTQGNATVEPRVGGAFALFDGTVSGEFTALTPHSEICMRWRLKMWPEGHYSDVRIALADAKDGCRLTLEQKNVPVDHVEATQGGWNRFYWERIKAAFGYGSL